MCLKILRRRYPTGTLRRTVPPSCLCFVFSVMRGVNGNRGAQSIVCFSRCATGLRTHSLVRSAADVLACVRVLVYLVLGGTGSSQLKLMFAVGSQTNGKTMRRRQSPTDIDLGCAPYLRGSCFLSSQRSGRGNRFLTQYFAARSRMLCHQHK